mmetsp:Transcript_14224/g.18498  ORF Transcript_14224/g.18498 Transcript_14224/m.18498 type:complete len:146 (-) Transcript_14224:145-582(-)
MAIEANDQRKLWLSLESCDKIMFSSVDRSLRLKGAGAGNDKIQPHSIPIRIIIYKNMNTILQPVCKPPYNTLGNFLNKILAISSLPQDKDNDKDHDQKAIDSDNERYRVICHGVDIPLDAPLVDIWVSLQHPDHFLYLSVFPISR